MLAKISISPAFKVALKNKHEHDYYYVINRLGFAFYGGREGHFCVFRILISQMVVTKTRDGTEHGRDVPGFTKTRDSGTELRTWLRALSLIMELTSS